MKAPLHRVERHASAFPGVEAITLSSERAFPRHAHDELGIGIVHAGAQRSWSVVGQVEAQAGDVIMVNPGEVHDGIPLGGARRWTIMYFDPAVVAGALDEENAWPDWTVRPVARDRCLADRVRGLIAATRAPSADRLTVEERLFDCIARIHEGHEVRGPRPRATSPSVARALQRIDAAPHEPVSLADLACECDLTRFQLLRGFAREVGTTPNAYRLQRRAALARRLLREGRPAAEVAMLSGFADQSHLTRAFVRLFGITPGRYRAQAGPAHAA